MTGKELVDFLTPLCNTKTSQIFSDNLNTDVWKKIKPSVKKLITLKDDLRGELDLTIERYRDQRYYTIDPEYLRWRVGRKTMDVCIRIKDIETNGYHCDYSILESLSAKTLAEGDYEENVRHDLIRARLEVINRKMERTLQTLGALEEEKEKLKKEIGI